MLVPKDDDRRPGEIPIHEGLGRRSEARAHDLHALLPQGENHGAGLAVPMQLDPFFGRARGAVGQSRKFFFGIIEMHPEHAKGVTAAQDGGHIVRVVDVVQDQGQIGLALFQDAPQTELAFFCQKSVGHGL